MMRPIKIAYVVTTIQHATKPLLAIAEKMESKAEKKMEMKKVKRKGK